MKLPSIRQLREDALDTFERFPFAILSAVVGTAAVLIIIQNILHPYFDDHRLHNAGAVAFLGISLFTALQLIAENKNWSFNRSLAAKLGALCLLVGYYVLLPQDIFESASVHAIRYFLFVVAAHMFVAIAPFMERGHIGPFWEFNKSLFLRSATAMLYTSVLFTGLAVALVAIDKLFTADIDSERYFQLWWFLVGVFNTCFFLSGVPRRTGTSDAEIRYPKGLKVFAQYVMIPLVAVYLCILYAYMGKIILEWDWPKGWVGYLVLGFSTTGILSLLLIHPIKDRAENSWMAVVWRWFYIVIIPLAALLLLAIWRRTSEYGITERRYFVFVLGFWLAAIALYFLISKTKSIKLIPITLCSIALLVSFGPWGAFSISKRNQVQRLEQVLIKNSLLENGKVQKAKADIPFADAKRISSIARYLAEIHGIDVLQPWFTDRIDSGQANQNRSRRYRGQGDAKRVARLLGVRYVEEWELPDSDKRTRRYTFCSDTMNVMQLYGYRYLVRNVKVGETKETATIRLGRERWDVSLVADSAQILFVPSSDASAYFSVDLKSRLTLLRDLYALHEYTDNPSPRDVMMVSITHGNMRMQLFLESITVYATAKSVVPVTVTMDIVIANGAD